jgi:cathepsin L
MNKSYAALAVLVVATALLYSLEPTQARGGEAVQYLAFLRQFNKPVPHEAELIYRSKLFAEYVAKMERHNADASKSWKMGVNQFSDLTQDEFKATYLGELPSETPANFVEEPVNAGFTETVDWRNKGIITDIRDQGACGSCWAFAATAAHESYQVQFHSQPNNIHFSEQQLVDCATGDPYNNYGCNGGFAFRALQYIQDFGQTFDEEYPYVAVNQACKIPGGKFSFSNVASFTGCTTLEEQLTRRPIAVRVDATNWATYKSGVFDNCEKDINHAVFLVGSSDEAWTIKNSWGTLWGESGYIKLAKGDTCAVCQGPSFPV